MRHELVGEVRGEGLFIGVEFVRDRATGAPADLETARIVNAMRERGVLIGASGRHANVLKLRPPLPFAEEHADILVSRLDEVLAEGIVD